MVQVLVLSSEGCKPCSRVKRVLHELQSDLPGLNVDVIDMGSPDGTRLATENNVVYPPAVFIDGKLFAKGKVDAELMTEAIKKLYGSIL